MSWNTYRTGVWAGGGGGADEGGGGGDDCFGGGKEGEEVGDGRVEELR